MVTVGFRPLFCPVCGVQLRVETDGTLPATFRLPDHEHGPHGNLCGGYDITIVFALAKCADCGCDYAKHPTGVCLGCFKKREEKS